VPVPLVAEFDPTASQLALLVVVQAQPAPAVTLVEPLVAVAATLALDGENANVQLLVPEVRKLATVAAFWLCTRVLSDVAVVPSGCAGLP
jgi:hypothetical protein